MIPLAVGAGAVIGLGLFLLLWQALPGTPAAGRALRRLHPEGFEPVVTARAQQPAWWQRFWKPPHRELKLLGRTPHQYAVSLGASAMVGLAVPALAGATAAVAGIGIPFAIPVAVSLGFAALAALLAHFDVISKADKARYEFRRAVCSYLDLVSLELAAGHGPVAALERAGSGVDAWVFERLREALLRAQLQLHQPWDELRELASTIDVPELGDVGDIVHAAGADGAVVHETLLARADSLRDQIRVEALALAKATTTKLDIPGAALLLVLAIFIIYPLLTRVG